MTRWSCLVFVIRKTLRTIRPSRNGIITAIRHLGRRVPISCHVIMWIIAPILFSSQAKYVMEQHYALRSRSTCEPIESPGFPLKQINDSNAASTVVMMDMSCAKLSPPTNVQFHGPSTLVADSSLRSLKIETPHYKCYNHLNSLWCVDHLLKQSMPNEKSPIKTESVGDHRLACCLPIRCQSDTLINFTRELNVRYSNY